MSMTGKGGFWVGWVGGGEPHRGVTAVTSQVRKVNTGPVGLVKGQV